jgi:DNA-binding CsgD family transcriptional regulator
LSNESLQSCAAIRNKIFQEQEGARRIALSESLRQVERQRKEIIRLEQWLPANSRDGVLMQGKGSRGKPASIPIRDLAFRYPTLSPTELRICDLIRKSVSSKEIASLLDRSVRTVEWHRASIRQKLHLSRVQPLELKLM